MILPPQQGEKPVPLILVHDIAAAIRGVIGPALND
jgi:hypothetical protein